MALFAYAIGFSLAYLRIPAGTGALLLIAAVQVTMLAGGLLGGERPPPREWAGHGLALVGLVFLTRPGLAQPDPLGAALMMGAGVAWGLYSLLGRGAGNPLALNASHFARSVPLALLGSAVGFAVASPHLTPLGAGLALTSGALTSGVGYAVWYAALRGLGATQAAIVQLSVPPVTAGRGRPAPRRDVDPAAGGRRPADPGGRRPGRRRAETTARDRPGVGQRVVTQGRGSRSTTGSRRRSRSGVPSAAKWRYWLLAT